MKTGRRSRGRGGLVCIASLDLVRQPREVPTNTDFDIELLDGAASRDAGFVAQLTDLINEVYAKAERGLWCDGFRRTSTGEIAELIAARQVAVARNQDGRVVGSVHVHQTSEQASELGMLVAAPDQRGSGIGRTLVEFAERHSREQGLRVIQLELLVPQTWRHPSKEFLSSWYSRIGYRVIRIGTMDDAYPHLAPLLATP